MFGKEETYCRLCAEPTPEELLIKSNDSTACDEKMLWFNIDVSATDCLPKTICFSCFDLLEKTCKFLENVRAAQQTLSKIYMKRTIADCKVKADMNGTVADEPLDKNWVTIAEEPPKSQIETEDHYQSLHESASNTKHPVALDEKSTKELDNSDDQACYNDNNISNTNDQPVSKLKENEKDEIHYEDEIDPEDFLPDPNAEMIVLDMSSIHSLRYVSWASYTWRCAHCDAQYKSVSSLRLHSLELHSCCCVFKCSDCDLIVTNHDSFVSHVRTHHNMLLYSCEFCNEQYDTMHELKEHKILEHSNVTYCQNCGESFDSPEQLFDHAMKYAKAFSKSSKKRQKAEDVDLKCKQCGREYSTKVSLRDHILLHSERSRDFACHVCGKTFFTKATLNSHMTVHRDARYKCDFCEMAFKNRANMMSHVSLHSGAKPFACKQCGKRFRTNRYLKSHSIVHTDSMPFVCEHCKKAFRFKTRLDLHMRQHTGVKPYMCLDCDRDFTNYPNFQKHMRRRHNVALSKRKTYAVVKQLSSINNNNKVATINSKINSRKKSTVEPQT